MLKAKANSLPRHSRGFIVLLKRQKNSDRLCTRAGRWRKWIFLSRLSAISKERGVLKDDICECTRRTSWRSSCCRV